VVRPWLRRTILALVAASVAGFFLARRYVPLAEGSQLRSFTWGSTTRSYVIHPGPAAKKTALLVALHGHSRNGKEMERRSGFDPITEAAGAVAIYPDAIDASWNDGWWQTSPDDVGFLAALIESVRNEYGIEKGHVFGAGHSNGAAMIQRLACETDSLDAFAAVACGMPKQVREKCTGRRAIPALLIHGTEDPIVPLDGEVKASVATWVERDGCPPMIETALPDLDPGDGTRVKLETYAPCRDGVEVRMYRVEGGGHDWPGTAAPGPLRAGRISRDLDASKAIWEFFNAHRR